MAMTNGSLLSTRTPITAVSPTASCEGRDVSSVKVTCGAVLATCNALRFSGSEGGVAKAAPPVNVPSTAAIPIDTKILLISLSMNRAARTTTICGLI